MAYDRKAYLRAERLRNAVNIKTARAFIVAEGLWDAEWTQQNDALVGWVGDRKPNWDDDQVFNKAEDLTDAMGR